MKRIATPLFLLILMFLFLPNVSAKPNVEIKEIYKIEERGMIEEISEPTYNDLNLIFNVRFNKVEDLIKYKVVLENTSGIEYDMDLNIESLEDNYIKYDISYDDDLNVVAANGSKTFYITISYKNKQKIHTAYYLNSSYSVIFNLNKS